MAEIIEANFDVIDNLLKITTEMPLEDNCQYEIRLKNFSSLDGKAALESYTYKVVTTSASGSAPVWHHYGGSHGDPPFYPEKNIWL